MATNGTASKAPGLKQNQAPNQTLYVTNLNDKMQKEDLRRALYCLFSTYGPVLDVVALKTMKMRGQAHITFRDIQTSTQAMRSLQGYEFFGKEMNIQYAKGKSAVIAKLDGTADLPKLKPEAGTAKTAAQSIFNAPSQIPQAAPQKTGSLKPNGAVEDGGKSPGGVKRPREEDSGSEDAPMEEDDDDDAMEESDDD